MVKDIDGNEELQVYIGADSKFDDNVTVIKKKYEEHKKANHTTPNQTTG